MGDQQHFSAITDNPSYLEARRNSPRVKNWSWTPSLKGSTRIIQDWKSAMEHDRDHPVKNMVYERLVADDEILPKLSNETERHEHCIPSPHPIQAHNGPELLCDFGFTEIGNGEVIWQ